MSSVPLGEREIDLLERLIAAEAHAPDHAFVAVYTSRGVVIRHPGLTVGTFGQDDAALLGLDAAGLLLMDSRRDGRPQSFYLPSNARRELAQAKKSAPEVDGMARPDAAADGPTGEGSAHQRGLGVLSEARLDPELARAALDLFRLGQHADAVLLAMRTVEIRVRGLGALPDELVGKPLMQEAFKEGGPLNDPNLVKAEREAILSLFVGAVGAFKNPPSHRIVNIEEPQEAAELILFANTLLRLSDRAAQAKAKRESVALPRITLKPPRRRSGAKRADG